MNAYEATILSLLKRGLFDVETTLDDALDFDKLYEEAKTQTVLPLAYAALTEEERAKLPSNLKAKWKGTFYAYLRQNEQVIYEQARVLVELQRQGIPCVVLKGSGVAREYPDPALRILGDIDLLIPSDQTERASACLQTLGFREKAEGDLHLSLQKETVVVELHKRPVALGFNDDAEIAEAIDGFFADTLEQRQTEGDAVYPSDLHQAVTLLLHKLEHFLKGELGLRQLCDWAVFVKNRCTPELLAALTPRLKQFGIWTFAKVVTKACVDFLGLPSVYAEWTEDCDGELAKEFVELVLESGNFGRKVENSYGQRLFVDAHSNNRFTSFFKVLFATCRTHWTPCAKHPILLPIAPFFVYAKYLKLRRQGKRKKLRLSTLYRRAGTRQTLYKELKPFVKEKEETS